MTATATAVDVEALRRAAVDAITAAARAGTDVAELVALVLAAAAANVGGTEQLLDGRPGSWEADLARQLVAGTVGWDEEHLPGHRTDPIVVDVDVVDLMETDISAPGRLSLDDRWTTAIEAPTDAWYAGDPHDDLDEDAYAVGEAAAWEASEAVVARRDAAYTAVGEAIRAEVVAEATRLGYTVPVEVRVHIRYRPGHDEYPLDSLEDRLLSAARERVTLPTP